MRITFMIPADDLTGGNRVVATYAKILSARGHDVLVVSNAPERPSWREQLRALRHGTWREQRRHTQPQQGHVTQSGVAFRRLDEPRPFTADDLPDADVLIATWWETAEWMDHMPASKGCKVHLIQDYEVWSGGAAQERVHAALRLPNCKIVISNELRHTLETHVGPLDITVIPNAVDLQQFDAPARQRNSVPTVGFMYGRAPRKAADLYPKVCALVRQRLPHLQVVAFSSEQPSPELPLPEGTTFFHRPPQDQIASIYACCDAWLFGSRIDSFGLPILEAMACHTPVIGVPVGAAPELLADGAGILVPPESPQAMADAIIALCTMPEADWQNMSQRVYSKAHSYNWNDATDRLLQMLIKQCQVNS